MSWVRKAGLLEAAGAKPAAVAQAAMAAAGRRIVAGPADPAVEAQPVGLADDVGLAHVEERSGDPEAVPFRSRFGGERGEPLEGLDEVGTAIGIARIIEGVDPDIDVEGPRRLRPAQRQRQED